MGGGGGGAERLQRDWGGAFVCRGVLLAVVPTGSAWAAGPVAFAQLWPGPSSCVDLTPGPRQPGASPAHVMHSQRDAWPRQPPPSSRAPPAHTPAPPPPQPPWPRCRRIPRGFIPVLGYPECVRGLGAHGCFYLVTPSLCHNPHPPGRVTFDRGSHFYGAVAVAAPGLGCPHAAAVGGVYFLTWRRENGGGREWKSSSGA